MAGEAVNPVRSGLSWAATSPPGLYEDARDVAEKDPATAGMLMQEA